MERIDERRLRGGDERIGQGSGKRLGHGQRAAEGVQGRIGDLGRDVRWQGIGQLGAADGRPEPAEDGDAQGAIGRRERSDSIGV